MANRTLNWNPPDDLTPEWIAYVDEHFPSPAEQGNKILEQINNPFDDPWAMIFFAVEILGNVALPMFGRGTNVAQHITELGRDFYALHYFKAPELYDLQRVTKEEVDENGVFTKPEADKQSPEVSEPGPDGPNGSP